MIGCSPEPNAAAKWLQPGLSEEEACMLEQFVEGLPVDTAWWVRCHRPTSVEVAVTLAEDHLAARVERPERVSQPPGRQVPMPAQRRRIPVPSPVT